ncbi:MAG: hypothetical protein NWE98_02065 [Candidatus Bathyarchaeota archaeon]|nr:hypothetical protein [Candidatus Bathyarchaeota archaeon]
MTGLLLSQLSQASTDSYASLLKIKADDLTKVTFVLANLHSTRAINYKVLVSNDQYGSNGSFAQDISEGTLNGGTSPIVLEPKVGFCWYDLQIKSASAGQSANVSAWAKVQ